MRYYSFVTPKAGQRTLQKNGFALLLKRLLEAIFVTPLLVLLTPFWFFHAIGQGRSEGLLIYTLAEPIDIGSAQSASDFYDYSSRPFYQLVPMFWHILLGRISVVGAAPVECSEEEPLYRVLGVRPGLFSTYSLKRQANLMLLDRDYEMLSYIGEASLKTDFGILLRSLIGRLIRSGAQAKPASFEMLDVAVDNMKIDPALEWISSSAVDRSKTSTLAFVNPDCFNIAFKNTQYRQTLSESDRVFADGIGVHIGCGMLGLAMHDNLNGTDLFPRICELAQAENLSIYLLGAAPGVTDQVVANILLDYPNLRIAGHRDGYFSTEQNSDVVAQINKSEANILLVAMGAPRQEAWIAENREQLRVGLAMGVGGLFDFVSGNTPRAPLWMREIGLEWTYRLYQEPGRMWRRYILGNPLFIYRIWRYKKLKRKGVGLCQS